MWHVCGGVRCVRCFGGQILCWRFHLEDLRIDGKIVLKWGFKRYEMDVDWICLDQEMNVPVASWRRSTAFNYSNNLLPPKNTTYIIQLVLEDWGFLFKRLSLLARAHTCTHRLRPSVYTNWYSIYKKHWIFHSIYWRTTYQSSRTSTLMGHPGLLHSYIQCW